MALTLEAEQRLGAVGLLEFFQLHGAMWEGIARDTYEFVRGTFPPNAIIRPDDVAKVLKPIVEVSRELRDELNRNKLKQKFWISDFTDLIIDRTWNRITHGGGENEDQC
jgi:hypothetical protein